MRTALITGVAGQDGTYLARSLLADGFRVVGVASPSFTDTDPRLTYLAGVDVRRLDVADRDAVRALVADVRPDEVYNLAALSSVGRSWQEPEQTIATNGAAVQHLVEAVLELRDETGAEARLFQASSAELQGEAAESPYARSKAMADEVVQRAVRERGLFAVSGILYNHESPLRPAQFVTRKITLGAAEIALGRRDVITLGRLDVRRDWGFAGEYVEAMRLLLGQDEPREVPIGTGVVHSLHDLLVTALEAAGVPDPEGRVEHDPALVRPADTAVSVADPGPAAEVLGWRATVTFEELVEHMVAVDLERLRSGAAEDVGYLLPRRLVGR